MRFLVNIGYNQNDMIAFVNRYRRWVEDVALNVVLHYLFDVYPHGLSFHLSHAKLVVGKQARSYDNNQDHAYQDASIEPFARRSVLQILIHLPVLGHGDNPPVI